MTSSGAYAAIFLCLAAALLFTLFVVFRVHRRSQQRRHSRAVQPIGRRAFASTTAASGNNCTRTVSGLPSSRTSPSLSSPRADERTVVRPTPRTERLSHLSMHQIEELQPADEEQALAFAVERSLSHSTEQPDTSNAEKAVQQAV
eukprot:CAMPEP_0174731888 /NCGR_PEP_ID=MMETSP1094-20130205/58346_1 /TAXON_ID=156173 /ORGANISM="Chrysochromulina brevifilum, Strain UTEX LB 985" /LENGTH=144 /DNA_ID=CAMNT_0015934321 /DNA_START=48 /DNA_END=479 /DNA_ORIENTATION=+